MTVANDAPNITDGTSYLTWVCYVIDIWNYTSGFNPNCRHRCMLLQAPLPLHWATLPVGYQSNNTTRLKNYMKNGSKTSKAACNDVFCSKHVRDSTNVSIRKNFGTWAGCNLEDSSLLIEYCRYSSSSFRCRNEQDSKVYRVLMKRNRYFDNVTWCNWLRNEIL